MTDDDSILFGGNNQTNTTNSWSTISIDPSFITTNSITYTQLYRPYYRYDYAYDYTNSYNKEAKKKTPSLKKKVLSNPLFTLTEKTKSDEPRE